MKPTTAERLRTLRLGSMADRWERQEAQLDERGMRERFEELLDAQEEARADTTLRTGLRRAEVPVSSARLADVRYERGRGLTTALVDGLKSGAWLRAHRNLVLLGGTGRGKTWLASALATHAVGEGVRVRYFDVRRLLQEWCDHEQGDELARFMNELSRVELLVLDRWAAHPVNEHEIARLEELVLARDRKASFLVCSTEPTSKWAAWLGGDEAAEGIVDRLLSHASVVELKGKSLR